MAQEITNELTENQLKWLEALESGEWKQGSLFLFDGEGYCCLGVATKIFSPNTRAIQGKESSYGVGTSRVQLAPKPTVKAMNFHKNTGDIYGILPDMNDEGKTFKEIASWVRENPWKVFTNFEEPEGELQ